MMDKKELRKQLEVLKKEHRGLDDKISDLLESGNFNHIELQRMKKHKLWLKDQIMKIEDRLIPDIIA